MPSLGIAGAVCCICKTFSSNVIRETRSATRIAIGCEGSWYGAPCGFGPEPGAPSCKAGSMNSRKAIAVLVRFEECIYCPSRRRSVHPDLKIGGTALTNNAEGSRPLGRHGRGKLETYAGRSVDSPHASAEVMSVSEKSPPLNKRGAPVTFASA